MKKKLTDILRALDSERAYGALLLIIGFSCLTFSSFAPIVLDIVTVASGIFLFASALIRLVLLLKENGREILYFSNLVKEAILIFAGVILLSFRSEFANAVCAVVGIYLILRSVATIILIASVGRRDGLSTMEKAEIIISVALSVLGVIMIIFPRFSNILVGITFLGKGLELILKNPPPPSEKKNDDYVTEDFVDKSDE